MLLSSLIWLPVLAGLLSFLSGREAWAKAISTLTSIIVLAVAFFLIRLQPGDVLLRYQTSWLGSINATYSLLMDGASKICVLLTAFCFVLVFVSGLSQTRKNNAAYHSLLLFTMAGLMGVFLSADALLFYFFWELALIPVYFLCSQWGGERRIPVTFTFFIYTFVGSVLMLVGIIYLYHQTADKSFAWESFKQVQLTAQAQMWFFWLFFIAFAIKMPIFPFHTWQPDTYETSPTSTTMVLSAAMVKMGLFAVIRWLLPVFEIASQRMSGIIMALSIIGILYASLIAMRQSDLKRLIAYSSIAHIGLMCAALFSGNRMAYDGVLIQMFNHAINIAGLWLIVDIIEQQTGIRNMNQLGGLARVAPWLSICFVIICLANIALPLTNAFVGEFLMFNGLWQRNMWLAILAGLSIILAAVYTLGMISKVFFGEREEAAAFADINLTQAVALTTIIALILLAGVYPKPLFHIAETALQPLAMLTTP